MVFFRRIFYFLILNFFIVTTAGILGFFITNALGIEGEWGFLIVFYSLIGFGGAFFSLFISRWTAKKFMGVRVIDPQTAKGFDSDLVSMVHDIAKRARLPVAPEVGIYKSPSPNAFATGPSKRKSLVAFSDGLINSMNPEELEGVIAHEVAHIANGDMVTMTLLQGMINTMVLIAARAVAKIIVSKMRERSFWLEFSIYMGLQVVFSILGSIVLAYYSRIREYRADKDGARFSSSSSMISALKALQRLTTARPEVAYATRGSSQEQIQYLQMSSRTANWLSTHPPLTNRIERLEKYYS